MQRILAIKWRQLGDSVLWTSALAAMRQHFPDAEIDLCLPAPWTNVFTHDQRFCRIYPRPRKRREWVTLIREVRARKYDWALNFHASPSSALFTRLSGARERVIHLHDRAGRQHRWSHRPIPRAGMPMSAQNRDCQLLEALGWTGNPPPTQISLASGVWESARRACPQFGTNPSPYVVFGVRASRPAKQWPLSSYRALAERLPLPFRAIVLAESSLVAESIRGPLGDRVEVITTPRLVDALAWVSQARAFVGGDSGLKHAAIALGVRTLTLFGPESIGEWHGYDTTQHPAVQIPVLCRNNHPTPAEFAWCGAASCPLSSHACLTLISPDRVAEALRPLIQ